MGKASVVTTKSANSRGADICTTKGSSPHSNSVIMLQAHSLWPLKTAAAVAEITGYAIRTVKDWDAGNARIPADALMALLQSEWGREFLAAVMANNEPRWWVKIKAFFRAVDVLSMQRITRRKLKEALDEEAASQTFAISSAALFQDEDFYAGQPSPLAAMAQRRKR